MHFVNTDLKKQFVLSNHQLFTKKQRKSSKLSVTSIISVIWLLDVWNYLVLNQRQEKIL